MLVYRRAVGNSSVPNASKQFQQSTEKALNMQDISKTCSWFATNHTEKALSALRTAPMTEKSINRLKHVLRNITHKYILSWYGNGKNKRQQDLIFTEMSVTCSYDYRSHADEHASFAFVELISE